MEKKHIYTAPDVVQLQEVPMQSLLVALSSRTGFEAPESEWEEDGDL